MNDVTIKLRLSAALLKRLKKWADKNGLSVSAAVRLAIVKLMEEK